MKKIKENSKFNVWDIFWYESFSGQYEIKESITGSLVDQNIILLDSKYLSIPTPIEVSGNSQILCYRATFEKCTQTGSKAGGIHSTCSGLSIKSATCNNCKSGSSGSFVYHSAQTSRALFSIDICAISSCIANSAGALYSQFGRFSTKSINISDCQAYYITAVVTDSTDLGSFHRFNIINNNKATSDTTFSLEERTNIMRDCIFTNNKMGYPENLIRGILQTFGAGTVSKVEQCIFEGNSGQNIAAADSGASMVLISCFIQSNANTNNVVILNQMPQEDVLFLISYYGNVNYVKESSKNCRVSKVLALLFINLLTWYLLPNCLSNSMFTTCFSIFVNKLSWLI